MSPAARAAAQTGQPRQVRVLLDLLSAGTAIPREAMVVALWGPKASPEGRLKQLNALVSAARKAVAPLGLRVELGTSGAYALRRPDPETWRHDGGGRLADVSVESLRGARVEQSGPNRSWRVVAADGRPLSGGTSARELALDMLDDMRRRARRRERPCISCGTPIHSEGPHHRMCATCRREGDSGWLNGEAA